MAQFCFPAFTGRTECCPPGYTVYRPDVDKCFRNLAESVGGIAGPAGGVPLLPSSGDRTVPITSRTSLQRRSTTFLGNGPNVMPGRLVVGGSEPPLGGNIVPGIADTDILGTGITIGDVVDVGRRIFGGNGGNGNGVTKKGFVADPTKGPCPGIGSVRGPDGVCINLGDLGPGGDPAITGQVTTPGFEGDGFGPAVRGLFGVGIVPRVDVQTVRRCPPGTALGKDGVCYEGLSRNSPRRMHPMGQKPLLTGGDRAAIRRAARAGKALQRAKKQIKTAGRSLEKAC